jgi:hypothetical protein
MRAFCRFLPTAGGGTSADGMSSHDLVTTADARTAADPRHTPRSKRYCADAYHHSG